MSRVRALFAFGFFTAGLLAAPAVAQFPSQTLGFNGPPIDDPATSAEMFRKPQLSGTTDEFITADPDFSTFVENGAFRAAGLQTEGAAALQVFFNWIDPTDPDAWLRLTTFDGARFPNPTLDTQGKVRFKLNNLGDFFDGEIGLILGIRETGTVVPQLADGGSSGPLEWVGVDPTPNAVTAGEDGIVDTVASGDDVQELAVGTDLAVAGLPAAAAAISPGANGVIDTTPAGDDALRSGFRLGGADGTLPVPIPAVTLPVSPFAYDIEFDLATGNVTVDGSTTPAGIAGFTGNGVLDAPNDRGTLEHLAITNLTSDPATFITFAIDELQFEATSADPVLPPTVSFPIVAGDTSIIVSNLVNAVDQVNLLRNGVVIDTVTSGLPADEVEFTIAPAVTGDVYTATQRSADSGVTSAESLPITVVADPPPFTFALLVDESGSGSCSFASPGWEWVNATSVTSFVPTGATPLVIDDAVWQVIDIPLDNDDLIIPSLGGNGALVESPAGVYTIDSLWFTGTDAAGTEDWEVLIDSVQALDAEGNVTQRLLDFEDGVNRLPFIRGQSPDDVTASALLADGSFGGASSHRIQWTYDGEGAESIGVLQRVGASCATAELIDDDTRTLRFYMVIRGPQSAPGTPLPVVAGPLVGAVDEVTVSHDPAATSVELYVDGVLEATTAALTGTSVTFSGLSGVLSPGASVSAKQVVGGVTSDFAYPRGVADAPSPAFAEVLVPGQTSVLLNDLLNTPGTAAELVTIYANGAPIGSIDPAGASSVSVPVTALVFGDEIQASQTVNGAEGTLSLPVTVTVPAPTVLSPLDVDETEVTVTDVHPLATAVTVTVDGSDTTIDPLGVESVNVVVAPLQPGDVVSATQTIAGIESGPSNAVFVANSVVINELNWDDGTVGAQGADDFEFVELYNGGTSAVDISGYRIDFGDAGGVDLTETVPAATVLQPGEFYVLGDPALLATVPGGVATQAFTNAFDVGDGQDYVALRSPAGVLLDAVAYETNKSDSIDPDEILVQIGPGIWGNHRHNDLDGTALLTSVSRALDGLDSDDNGRDFVVQRATPGASNNAVDRAPYFEDVNALAPGAVPAEWTYSFVGPTAINPGVADAFNTSAIPASPDGGNALIAWDPAGGGNTTFIDTLAEDDVTLELYLYIAPALLPSGFEETKIGIRGRNGAFHNIGAASDATGLVWVYDRSSTGQSLTLADFNNGGNDPVTIGTIDIGTDPALTGWQRLLLEARGEQVIGIFGGTYGSRTDGITITGTHDSPGPGGIYAGYREGVAGTPPELRPTTFDAVSVTLNSGVPIGTGDANGDGRIDLIDVAALQRCMGASGLVDPCLRLDMDGDDAITFDDVTVILGLLEGP